MNIVKKVTVAISLAVISSSCATSKVNLKKVSDGDLSGDVKIQLQAASVELSQKEVELPDPDNSSKKIKVKKWDIEAKYHPSQLMYIASPVRRRWVDTELAPVYKSGTSRLESIGVETKDKRAEFASKIVEIAKIIGPDLTFLDADEDPICKSINQSDLAVSMKDLERGAGSKQMNVDSCQIQMEFGPIPPDAVSVTDFDSFIKEGKKDLRVVPYAACRATKVTFSTLKVTKDLALPDERYVRVQKLPYKGKVVFDEGCGAPSIEAEGDQTPDDLEALKGILEAFQNEEKDNSASNDTTAAN